MPLTAAVVAPSSVSLAVAEHCSRAIKQLQRVVDVASEAVGDGAGTGAQHFLRRAQASWRLLDAISGDEALEQAPAVFRGLRHDLPAVEPALLRARLESELMDTNQRDRPPPPVPLELSTMLADEAARLQWQRQVGHWYFSALVALEVAHLHDDARAYLGANQAMYALTRARQSGCRGRVRLTPSPLPDAPVPSEGQLRASEKGWLADHAGLPMPRRRLLVAEHHRYGCQGGAEQAESWRLQVHLDRCETHFLLNFEVQSWLAFFGTHLERMQVRIAAKPFCGTFPVGKVPPDKIARRAEQVTLSSPAGSSLRHNGADLAEEAWALDHASRRDGLLALRAVYLWKNQVELAELAARLQELEADAAAAALGPPEPAGQAGPAPAPAAGSTLPTAASAADAAVALVAERGPAAQPVDLPTRLTATGLHHLMVEQVDPATFARPGRSPSVAAGLSLAYHMGKHAPPGTLVEDYIGAAQRALADEDPREVLHRSDMPDALARVLRTTPTQPLWGLWGLDGRMISFCDRRLCPRERGPCGPRNTGRDRG